MVAPKVSLMFCADIVHSLGAVEYALVSLFSFIIAVRRTLNVPVGLLLPPVSRLLYSNESLYLLAAATSIQLIEVDPSHSCSMKHAHFVIGSLVEPLRGLPARHGKSGKLGVDERDAFNHTTGMLLPHHHPEVHFRNLVRRISDVLLQQNPPASRVTVVAKVTSEIGNTVLAHAAHVFRSEAMLVARTLEVAPLAVEEPPRRCAYVWLRAPVDRMHANGPLLYAPTYIRSLSALAPANTTPWKHSTLRLAWHQNPLPTLPFEAVARAIVLRARAHGLDCAVVNAMRKQRVSVATLVATFAAVDPTFVAFDARTEASSNQGPPSPPPPPRPLPPPPKSKSRLRLSPHWYLPEGAARTALQRQRWRAATAPLLISDVGTHSLDFLHLHRVQRGRGLAGAIMHWHPRLPPGVNDETLVWTPPEPPSWLPLPSERRCLPSGRTLGNDGVADAPHSPDESTCQACIFWRGVCLKDWYDLLMLEMGVCVRDVLWCFT